jgi:Ca-activated chloride channel family protein
MATLLITLLIFRHGNAQEVHIVPQLQPPHGESSLLNHFKEGKFRVRSNLVLVPVTVMDDVGRLVVGLDAENFHVFEGKEKQTIRHFSSEDAPASIGIVLDTSGSMHDKIEYARQAVDEFLKNANPQDEIFLITFSGKPELVTDFTMSINDIQSSLVYARPKGTTALLDTIYLAINKMRQARYAKKALLVISDGGDNHSRYTESEIKRLVREADTIIYSIGIYDHDFRSTEELFGPILLDKVSRETGGEMFTIANPKDSVNIAAKIGAELRHQYLLAYRPETPKYDGKWHKIKVKVSPPVGMSRIDIHAKQGYYATAD